MNGYIGIPEKVNENVGTQKIGMAEKVLGISHYGLRAFHRNPGGKPDYRVGSFRISISTASITALTKLLFVAIDTTSHKELLDMEVCHNSNKGVNDYTSSHRMKHEVSI